MANPAHESLLRQGVSEWNDWRAQNASVTPDLTGVRMAAAKLDGVDFSHALLRAATLIRSSLRGADLSHADLREAKLHEVDLSDANLYHADLEDASLAGAKLPRARLDAANLSRAQITVADFREADFTRARLIGADLRESFFDRANFEGADMTNALLRQSNLEGCNFKRVRGLDSRQIEVARLDHATTLPESLSDPVGAESIEQLAQTLESLRARAAGDAVLADDVSSYHTILDQLASKGIDTQRARIAASDLAEPATAPTRGEWVDAALFRRRVSSVLSVLRNPLK